MQGRMGETEEERVRAVWSSSLALLPWLVRWVGTGVPGGC